MIFTDRSRISKGLKSCPRARFLNYNLFSTGITTRQPALALSTGLIVHECLEGILKHSQLHGLPDRDSVRLGVSGVISDHLNGLAKSGYLAEDASHLEQLHLAESLVWCFYRTTLPWILENFDIISVEEEEHIVLGCNCGLGESGNYPAHEARKCGGVVLMSRPDFILKNKNSGAISLADFKTSSYPLKAAEYEHAVQLTLGMLASETRLEEPVDSYYIFGLIKGKREADKGSQVKRQRSELCYAYFKPGEPPFSKDELTWEYQKAKGWVRVPVWEIPVDSYSEDKITPAEWWVMDYLPEEVVLKQGSIVGPCQKQNALTRSLVRQVVALEKDWEGRQAYPPSILNCSFGEPAYQDLLDQTIPCSWDCREWNRDCEFVPICYRYPGWEEPLKMTNSEGQNLYVPRLPHHEPELKVFFDTGLLKEGQEAQDAEEK